jgi:hypothetical protein
VNYAQLEHAIRAACDVSQDNEVYVFGSQAILGSYPDAPPGLRASMEVDIQAKHRPETWNQIDGALGELSEFNRMHGFYVHGLVIEEAAILPEGWEDRTVRICDGVGTRGGAGLCLEAHDLAASKLAAFREKDREFVTVLVSERMISPSLLADRIEMMPLETARKRELALWLEATAKDLGVDRPGS